MTELIVHCEVLCHNLGQRVPVEDFCRKCDDCVDILRNGEDYEVKVICDYLERLQWEREACPPK